VSTKGRLTRQELGWLLTQEAQGAAERLRKGVQVLTKTIPPMAADSGTQIAVDDTLAALDDAMGMLSSLHHKPVAAKGRRGRIDVAALLWEIAPDARVSIEPGSGTEVFGDESELRRMLHMLVGPGSKGSSAIKVRRSGEEVIVEIELGPDSSAASEAERAWLHRMAIRYGGRYELTGGGEVLTLPADKLENRSEEEKLRRQLDEARRQGQAYARELASVVSQGEDYVAPSTFPSSGNTDRFSSLARLSGGVAGDLRIMLSPIGWDLLSLIENKDFASVPGGWEQMVEKLDAIQKRIMLVQDLVGELGNVGELDSHEAHSEFDLFDVAHAAVRHATLRAQKLGVEISLETNPPESKAMVRAAPHAAAVIFRQMIGHALLATPKGRHVHVTVTAPVPDGLGARVSVEDSGPFVPASELRAYLMLEVEPGTFGRPSSLALHLAAALVEVQGGAFELDGSQLGGIRASATFPKRVP